MCPVRYLSIVHLFNVQVNFAAEGAVDHGGPKREFFRLFAHKASQTYFRGGFMDTNILAVKVSVNTIGSSKELLLLFSEQGSLLLGSIHCSINCAGGEWSTLFS